MGYKVTTRTSSIDALELFKKDPDAFDLVITDMAMPKMAGDDLSKELLAIPPDILIILCTSPRITEEKARDMGICSLVKKPIVKKELAQITRRVLDGIK